MANRDGSGDRARFYDDIGLALSPDGSLYAFTRDFSIPVYSPGFVNQHKATIRKIDRTGLVTSQTYNLPIHSIRSMTFDADGNMYFLSYHSMAKVARSGLITSIVSGYPPRPGGNLLSGAVDLALDAAGRIFVANPEQKTILAVSQSGGVAPLAGNSYITPSQADGTGEGASFLSPWRLVMSSEGELLVADGSKIRKVLLDGSVSTLLDFTPTWNLSLSTLDSSVTRAIHGFGIDSKGVAYVTGGGFSAVWQGSQTGSTKILAGNPTLPGNANLLGEKARLFAPGPLAVTQQGVVFVVDSGAIKRIDNGQVSTFAGAVAAQGTGSDGSALHTLFWRASGLAFDTQGNLLVADAFRVRRINSTGNIQHLAGPTSNRYEPESIDGSRSQARFAYFYSTNGATDTEGNYYLKDINKIRRISPDGTVTTVAGQDASSIYVGGAPTSPRNVRAQAFTIDPNGDLIVAVGQGESTYQVGCMGANFGSWCAAIGPRRIAFYRVLRDGQLSLLYTTSDTLLSNGTDKPLRTVTAMTFDMQGGLLWSDGSRVFRIAGKDNTLVAGSVDTGYLDGSAATSRFDGISSLTASNSGEIFLAEAQNKTVRRISSQREVSTVLGKPWPKNAAGLPQIPANGIQEPTSLAMSANGKSLYISVPSGILAWDIVAP